MKILISYGTFPTTALDFQKAAQKRGWSTMLLDTNLDWINKNVFWKLNKWTASLHLVPKGTNLFKSHPKEHRNRLTSKLANVIKSYDPNFILFIHGQPYGKTLLADTNIPKVGW